MFKLLLITKATTEINPDNPSSSLLSRNAVALTDAFTPLIHILLNLSSNYWAQVTVVPVLTLDDSIVLTKHISPIALNSSTSSLGERVLHLGLYVRL